MPIKIIDKSNTLAILLIGFYTAILSFINPPITEGWFITYADALRNGKQIYADYDLFLPPLYTWLTYWIVSIFGTKLFAFKALGLLLVISIYVQLRIVYENFFNREVSIIAGCIGTLFYISNNAFISYDFTQVLTLLTLICLNCSLIYLRKQTDLILFLCNASAILGFYTKHSNGSYLVIFAIFFNLGVLYSGNFKVGLVKIFKQLTYAAVLLFVIHLPLILSDNFVNYINQIYINSITLKGGYEKVLFQWAHGFFTRNLLEQIFNILLGSLYFLAFATFVQLINCRFRLFCSYKNYSVVTLYFTTVVLGGLYLYFTRNSYLFLERYYNTLSTYIIPASFVLSLCMVLVGAISWSKIKVNKFIVVGIFSLLMFAANGSSAGLSQISSYLMLGFAYSVAASLYGNNLHRILLALIAALISIYIVAEKFNNPYHWWSINSEKISSKQILKFKSAILYNDENYNYINSIESLDKCEPDEEALAFPNIPYFYTMTKCYPSSRVLVPWFDFASQQSVTQMNHEIPRINYKYIAYLDIPENVYTGHEILFNAGNSMAQRETIKRIKEKISSNNYKLVSKFDFVDSPTLYIYERR